MGQAKVAVMQVDFIKLMRYDTSKMNQLLGKKILIVEDDSALRKVLVDKFTQERCLVSQAIDGEKGLQAALDEQPDLIILDIVMPRTDGIAMLDTLRKENEWAKTLPVIMLTNLELNDERLRMVVRDEPTYYLVKTTTPLDDLVTKVANILSSAHE